MSDIRDHKPLDLEQLKATVREASKHLAKGKADYNEGLFTLALSLSAAIKKTLYERAEAKFSQEPIIQRRGIVHFVKRMRVDAMEKFNQTTVFSTVYYFLDSKQAQKNEPVGMVVVYIPKQTLPELLRLLKYPYVDSEDEEEVKDGCGALANLIAGQFKKEFIGLGYQDLEMSHFQSFINTVADGLDFPQNQTDKYEISFHIDDVKSLVVEMIMDKLPRTYA